MRLIKNWYLDIEGDDKALPEILKRIGENNIDLIHYDSDKSYNARNKALKIFESKINSSNTIIIFDDIQDNLHFKDLVEKTKQRLLCTRISKILGYYWN
jgi:LytS/YehU family sensor histidine kinase